MAQDVPEEPKAKSNARFEFVGKDIPKLGFNQEITITAKGKVSDFHKRTYDKEGGFSVTIEPADMEIVTGSKGAVSMKDQMEDIETKRKGE